MKNRVYMAGQKEDPVKFLAALAAYWEHYSTPRTRYLHPTHKTEEEKRLARNTAARKRRATLKKDSV